MTKDEERECYLFGKNLALQCIHSYDNNKIFNESCKSLSNKDFGGILLEVVYFRCSYVFKRLFIEIKDKEKCRVTSDYFFSTLSTELQLNINYILEDIRKYTEIEVNHLIPTIIVSKAGIDQKTISNYSEFHFKFHIEFVEHLEPFISTIDNMFELFHKRSNKNFGCFGSVLAFIFVICLLTYVI